MVWEDKSEIWKLVLMCMVIVETGLISIVIFTPGFSADVVDQYLYIRLGGLIAYLIFILDVISCALDLNKLRDNGLRVTLIIVTSLLLLGSAVFEFDPIPDPIETTTTTLPMEEGHKLCKSLKDCSKLSKDDWNDKIKGRSLHVKHYDQLEYLRGFYPKKIQRISNLLIDPPCELLDEDRSMLEAKVLRLKDKYVTTLKEIEFREKKTFTRDPIGTTYYIDAEGGNDAAAGTGIGTAWKTVRKYTTLTSRTPGDIAYLRANQVYNQTGIDVICDEDGNLTDLIELRGASSTDDPWSDGSDVKAIVSFRNTAATFYLYGDDFWKFKNFEIINSTDTTFELFQIAVSKGIIIDNCVIAGTSSVGVDGFNPNFAEITIKNSEFYNNKGQSIYIEFSTINIINSNFNGGPKTTDYGIRTLGGTVYLDNCTFGVDTVHDLADIYLERGDQIYSINSKFDSPTTVLYYTYTWHGGLKSEDHNQVFNTSKITYYMGVVDKEDTIVRTGGASSSAKLSPNTKCGPNFPMTISESSTSGDFKVWTTAAQTNITIYIRGFGWTIFPIADELHIETSYLSDASSAERVTIKSDDVIADNTNWVGFDTIFTPARTGWTYVTLNLGRYEASSGIYCDIKPVVS